MSGSSNNNRSFSMIWVSRSTEYLEVKPWGNNRLLKHSTVRISFLGHSKSNCPCYPPRSSYAARGCNYCILNITCFILRFYSRVYLRLRYISYQYSSTTSLTWSYFFIMVFISWSWVFWKRFSTYIIISLIASLVPVSKNIYYQKQIMLLFSLRRQYRCYTRLDFIVHSFYHVSTSKKNLIIRQVLYNL